MGEAEGPWFCGGPSNRPSSRRLVESFLLRTPTGPEDPAAGERCAFERGRRLPRAVGESLFRGRRPIVHTGEALSFCLRQFAGPSWLSDAVDLSYVAGDPTHDRCRLPRC
jgi:hypothetical protein